MRKYLYAISVATIFLGFSLSCQKNEDPQQKKEDPQAEFIIKATIVDNSTKVTYTENESTHALYPKWHENDKIIGFDASGKKYGFSIKNGGGTAVAEFQLITSGDYSSTTTIPDIGTKMYMFYAPGKKPSDISEKSLTVSIASQSANNDNEVPALMMASGEVTGTSTAKTLSLQFENKTAIIGIKNPTIPSASSVTSITLTGTTHNKVTFGLNGTTLEATYGTVDGTNGKITKGVDFSAGTANTTTYIAVCPSASTNLDLTFTTSTGLSITKTVNQIVASNYYYATLKFKKPILLPGVFSVSSTKKVQFTNGNLYWDGDDWHIEDSQTEYPLTWNPKHVGHFYWATTAEASYDATYKETTKGTDLFFCDGSNIQHKLTVDGQDGLYALSDSQLFYLFDSGSYKNETRREKYSFPVSVNNGGNVISDCLVIAPDTCIGGYSFNNKKTSYSAEDWAAAEAAGIVCLPPAGMRSGSTVYSDDYGGFYWTSVICERDNTSAYYMSFFKSYSSYKFDPGYAYNYRLSGLPIRLVLDNNQ